MLDLRKQPIKGIYVLSQLIALLTVRLPFWTLISLVPAFRPRPSWTLARCIRVRIIGLLFSLSARCVLS
jgi:hypothetical protein